MTSVTMANRADKANEENERLRNWLMLWHPDIWLKFHSERTDGCGIINSGFGCAPQNKKEQGLS